jgi:mRNA interferase HigB
VRIIAFKTLREFWEKPEFSDSEPGLRSWYNEVKSSDWNNSNEVKKLYKSASVIGGGRIVFNIKGNSYRLVAAFNFEYKIVFIRFIGTHKEYDRINAKLI